MKIGFTKDAERERVEIKNKKRHNSTWEYYSSTNVVEAARTARDMGWKNYKVQVRFEKKDGVTTYYVEPFEDGCGCRNMLKYKDFFE